MKHSSRFQEQCFIWKHEITWIDFPVQLLLIVTILLVLTVSNMVTVFVLR